MFKGNLTIQKYDATKYKIIGYITYTNEDITITVKEGFLTDGASIPRMMWRVVGTPFTGVYTEGAVIHDALYGSHLTTKEYADKLFLEMLEESGVSWWKRNAMYYAVKWFGGSSWDKDEDKIRKVKEYVEINYNNTIS